jgi:hypothetical protein
MATYSRVLLSGSTNGRPIPVADTATPGTLLHTAIAGTSSFDELYLWVSNVTGSAATLTIEWGGVTNPGDHISKAVSVPANTGPVQVSFGQCVNGGVVVRAFSGTASALNITGFVNRIQ